MHISSRLAAIAPSATMAIDAKAKAMRRDGLPVISFGAGEPDFPTPAPIAQAGVDAIAAGHTKYTTVNGIPELREAISARLESDLGVTYSPEQIIVTNGAKDALYTAFQTLLQPGDEAIIPAPYWVSYEAQVLLAGAKPVIVETQESAGFKLQPAALQAKLTPRTRLLILNTPSNPTGAVYTAAELQALATVLHNTEVGIVTDEIYQRISYNGPSPSFVVAVPELRDRTILINGASKSYSMTGWRIGFAAGQYAAVEAFGGPQAEVDAMVRTFKERRDVIVTLLNAIPGVRCAVPDGAFYAFPNVEGVLHRSYGDRRIETSLELAAYLLEQAYVATVPGEAFGAPGYLRLSYACGMPTIEEGLARMRTALSEA